MNERFSSFFDLIQTLGDHVDWIEQRQLVLNFNQVVTWIVGGCGILTCVDSTRHHNSQWDEIGNNFVDDVTDTILSVVATNGWVEHHFAVLQIDFDVKDW